MGERMSRAEVEEHLALANEDLAAARDSLRLGHLRAAMSLYYRNIERDGIALLSRVA